MTPSLDPTLGRIAAVMFVEYQRYISPHKGYACAHRAWHGGDSCSEFARKVFAAEGCRGGFLAFERGSAPAARQVWIGTGRFMIRRLMVPTERARR